MDARVPVSIGHVEIAVRRDRETRRPVERWPAVGDRRNGLPVIPRVRCAAARPERAEELAVASESADGLIAVVREPERVVRRDGDAVSPHREDALAPRADEATVTLIDEHRVI